MSDTKHVKKLKMIFISFDMSGRVSKIKFLPYFAAARFEIVSCMWRQKSKRSHILLAKFESVLCMSGQHRNGPIFRGCEI